MKQRFVQVAQSVDRLSLRERLFLFAAALVVLGGLWEALLAAPLEARERIASDRVTALGQRLQQLNESVATAAGGMSEGMPNQLERLRAMRARVDEGGDEMRVYTSDLVDPAQMRFVLEDLLRRQGALKLVSAVNLGARPVVDDDGAASEPRAGSSAAPRPRSGAPTLYRHSLVLTLRGNYLDCLAYLEAVERLPWNLHWTRLEFSADAYPQNDIVIELTTLSLDEEWIGV